MRMADGALPGSLQRLHLRTAGRDLWEKQEGWAVALSRREHPLHPWVVSHPVSWYSRLSSFLSWQLWFCPLLFEIGFGLVSEIWERLNNPLEGRYRTMDKWWIKVCLGWALRITQLLWSLHWRIPTGREARAPSNLHPLFRLGYQNSWSVFIEIRV